jgi:LPPG:FO 2-phospho-L-lactate transferase
MNVVALAGGVGGAKLADGLAQVLPPEALTVVVNTADDFEWTGLHVSPDLDTVMYTLAGVANSETGWGLTGDTAQALDMLGRYGQERWFYVGDRDLATHILRTHWLREGKTLTAVTTALARALGVGATILPMSDERVATVVESDEGDLPFQEYFVRRAWQPVVRAIRFDGLDAARPTPAVMAALTGADAIILCPSNPYVSIGPIVALPGVRDALQSARRVLAVSPIVGGQALKGPAAKMMAELGQSVSAASVAQGYADILDGFVLDQADEAEADAVTYLGIRPFVADTIMRERADRVRLARDVLEVAERL